MQLTPVERPPLHLAADQPRARTAARLRDGSWVRVHRGIYVEVPPGLDSRERRRLIALARTFAVAEAAGPVTTVSHGSAALMRGLPSSLVPEVPHVTHPWRPARRSGTAVRHIAELPDEHCTMLHGVRVTTLARTLVDCALTMHPRKALAVVDAGLHIGADVGECLELLESLGPRRGVRQAREVLRRGDDGAESPGESLARFHALRIGLPPPTTQLMIPTDQRRFWTDFGWEAWKLVVEYDGLAKYTARGTATEAVLAERERERAIERAGYVVIRVVWSDIRSPGPFLARIREHVPPDVVARLRPRRHLNVP